MKSRKLVKLQQLDFWSLEKGKKNRLCLLTEVVRKQKRKRYKYKDISKDILMLLVEVVL